MKAWGGWTLNDPAPNFTLELEKCKPYQISWNIAAASRVRAASVSPNYIEFIVPVPTTLKKAPTLVYDGSLLVCTVDNMVVSGFTFASNIYGPGWVEIVASKTNHGMTDAQLRYTFSGDQHPLIFDSNL